MTAASFQNTASGTADGTNGGKQTYEAAACQHHGPAAEAEPASAGGRFPGGGRPGLKRDL